MKLNRILVIILAVTIAAGAVFSVVGEYRSSRAISEDEIEQYKSTILLPNDFRIIASDNCCGKALNSVEGANEGIKNGAEGVEINISFRSDGIPVLAEGLEYVNSGSVPAEEIFKIISSRSNLSLIINLKELSEFSKLLEQLETYKITDRVFFSDIDKGTAPYVTQEVQDTRLVYTLSAADGDLTDIESCTDCLYSAMNCGATAIRCPVSDATDILVQTAHQNLLTVFLTDADNERDLYKALSLNPNGIVTDSPDKLYEIIKNENLLVR